MYPKESFDEQKAPIRIALIGAFYIPSATLCFTFPIGYFSFSGAECPKEQHNMATKNDSGLTVNIKGNVTAGRDVIMHDQYNIGVTNVTTPTEFPAKLIEAQTAIAALKQQPDLTSAQKRNVEAAEQQVVVAIEET
jgi:hypothetical protein